MKKKSLFIFLILIISTIFLTSCQNPDDIIITYNTPAPEPTSTPIPTQTSKITPELKVYFFYVGQAESIFVQNGDECMLIDAGNNPDGKYISKYLRNKLGIKKIDYLVGTHAHEDHIGGIDIIIEDFEIGRFFMPDQATTLKTYTDVVSWAKKKDLEIESPKVGTTFNVGKAVCEVMTQNDDADNLNDTSIVLQLCFGDQKYLFTADIEEEVESSRTWDDIDVLKVAHHGTKYASTENFLKQAKPEIAVVCCGKDNEYAYPKKNVLDRLKKVGCNEIYVTKDDGTILITSDGLENKVEKLDIDLDGNIW